MGPLLKRKKLPTLTQGYEGQLNRPMSIKGIGKKK